MQQMLRYIIINNINKQSLISNVEMTFSIFKNFIPKTTRHYYSLNIKQNVMKTITMALALQLGI